LAEAAAVTDSKSEPFFERLILATIVGTAVAAFAQSTKQTWAWVFELPCAASLFFRIKNIPSLPRALAGYVTWAAAGLVVIVGLILTIAPVLSAQTVSTLTMLSGSALAFSSALFLLRGRDLSPGSGLLPAVLGLFVAAAFNPDAPLRGTLAVAGAAMFGYLAVAHDTVQGRNRLSSRTSRGLARLALSGLGTFMVAWSIIWVLPWAQTQVERGTIRFFPLTSQGYSPLASQSRLGELEQLKLSQKIAMRVWTSRPQKLRGRVFTHFDGQTWQARALHSDVLPPDQPQTALDHELALQIDEIPGSIFLIPQNAGNSPTEATTIWTKVVQVRSNQGMAVAPGGKLLVRLPLSSVRLDVFENLVPPASSTVEIYGVVNWREGDVVQRGTPSQAIISDCLAVATDTDVRLRKLAVQLAEGSASAGERINRTVSYLQSKCRYSLSVGRFHSQQPVAEFIFEKKQGYCEYFASAAVVLLRLEGVPSRYVTGFNLQEGNRQGDHYVVRQADAHAWVESLVPNRGWVEIDPTPEAEYEALHAGLKHDWLANSTEWAAAKLAEISARFGGGEWIAAFRWLWGQLKGIIRWAVKDGWRVSWPFLAAVLLLTVWLKRRRGRASIDKRRPLALPQDSFPAPREMAELMRRLDQLWARIGFARPASRAPLEHLALIPAGKISSSLREASWRIIDVLYRTTFGGVPSMPSEARELRDSLDRVIDNEHIGRQRPFKF
jgi:transglutaminase-like putative cysteine protease